MEAANFVKSKVELKEKPSQVFECISQIHKDCSIMSIVKIFPPVYSEVDF